MVILGIDPGFSVTGFAILQKTKQKAILLDYGMLKMSSSKTLIERVGIFHTLIAEKITTYHVTEIALETPFLGKNAQNFLKLGYLRGIVYLLVQQHKLILHEFSPREIKLSITGFGGADKDQVAHMIMRLFPGLIKPEKADVTDALAITVCGLWKNKNILSV